MSENKERVNWPPPILWTCKLTPSGYCAHVKCDCGRTCVLKTAQGKNHD